MTLCRPAVTPFFKTFGEHPQAAAVPVEDLDEIAAFVSEEEGGTTQGIGPEFVLHDDGESVEALAHVAGFGGEVDPESAVEG